MRLFTNNSQKTETDSPINETTGIASKKNKKSMITIKSRFNVFFRKIKNNSIIDKKNSTILKKKLDTNLVDSLKKKGSRYIDIKRITILRSKYHSKSATPNYLWIIFYVSKFAGVLKMKLIIKKLMNLKPYHYNMIGDKTYFDTSYNYMYNLIRFKNNMFLEEKNKLFQKIKDFKENLIFRLKYFLDFARNIEVFKPDNPVILLWNLIMLFFVVLNAFYVPLKLGFELTEAEVNDFFFFTVEKCSAWVFLFDIFIILNTAYFSKGVFISERFKILFHYIKYSAILDLLSLIPILLAFWTVIPYLHICFLLRILKLKGSIKKFEDFLQIKELQGGLMELIKLLFFILYVAHLCCCSWHYLAIYEIRRGEEKTWFEAVGVRNSEWIVRYVHSLYYSIVSMVTVGYGDIAPQNFIERLFAIGLIVLACGMFAYSVNEIGHIVQEILKLKQINSYMKYRGLNKNLQMRVQKYMEYMHGEDKFGYKNGEYVLTNLSHTLRKEVLMDIYGRILTENTFLREFFSHVFLKECALKMKETTFASGDLIFQEKQRDDSILYFIIKGSVEICQNSGDLKQKKIYRRIKKGDHFGAVSFLTNDPREVSAVSLTEKYRMLVDNMRIYNKINDLGKKCDSCGSIEHLTYQCGMISFIPNTKKIIEIYKNSLIQIRRRVFNRRKRIRNNSFNLTLKSAEKYAENNSKEVDHHADLYLGSFYSRKKSGEENSETSEESSKDTPPKITNISVSIPTVDQNLNHEKNVYNKFLFPIITSGQDKSYLSKQANAITLIPVGTKRESSALNNLNAIQSDSLKKQRKNSNIEAERLDQPSLQEQNNNLLKNIYGIIKNSDYKCEKPPELILYDENENIFDNFEIGKNYKEYFPQNNLETILASFKTQNSDTRIKILPKRQKRQLDSETIAKLNNFMAEKEASIRER